MSDTGEADWWRSLYDDIVADVFLVRKDPDELRDTVSFLLRQLRLSPGSRLLDQGCGVGSLALPLAQAGVHVIGVDQCPGYIGRARCKAERLGLGCEFHAGDAFHFRLDEPVDAALNWGTSFGNADDASNLHMLRRAHEALRPGGSLALDYQHVPRVLARFQPCLLHRHCGEHGETLIVRESTLDWARGVLAQRWTFVLPDGTRRVRHSAVRLYLPDALAGLLKECGFADVTFHGGVRGEALTLDSPRCILIARRPGP